jgi:IS66 Orf2 like protein
VFCLGAATRIYLAPGATDMRKGFNGLYGLVRDQLLCDPLSGHLFLFSNSQRNRLKVLFWDTTGLWVESTLRRRSVGDGIASPSSRNQEAHKFPRKRCIKCLYSKDRSVNQ